MKNFRKVLALVLVVATLFSLTAMASAKTYTDADKISYTEAVTVLSAVGILDGYEDDSFKPTNTISREEMAKMIAVLSNAGTDVSKLYASACTFADVAKDRWSASYVAYCAKTGIVAGRSASTFDPTGKVTGLETAKMLLVVLGFNAEKQGYVGSDWKVNVLRDAKVMGLLENFDAKYDIEKAITREEAAQMMLNALEAPCVVGFLSDNVVTVTNALIVEKAPNTLVGITSYAKLKDAVKAGNWCLYGNVVISDDLLAFVLFGLTRTTTVGRDCYGRPSTQWTYVAVNGETKTIGTYPAAPVFKSVNTNASALETALKAYKGMPATAFVDGEKLDDGSAKVADAVALVKEFLGKGVQVEAYFVGGEVTIVVINTYIGIVDHITKKGNEFCILVPDYSTKGYHEASFSNKGYGFEEGDMILFWLCGNKTDAQGNCTYTQTLHDAQIVEPVTGPADRATTNKGTLASSTVVSNGKTYEYAHTFGNKIVGMDADDIMGVDEVAASKNFGVEYDLYLDLNGYLMAWFVHNDAADIKVAYAVENTGKISFNGLLGDETYEYTATRDLVDFNAKLTKDAPVTEETWRAADDRQKWSWMDTDVVEIDPNYRPGMLFSYVEDGEGRADIVEESYMAVASSFDGDFSAAYLKKNGDIVWVDAEGDVVYTVYGNAETKYMVRTWNYDKDAYEYNVYDHGELPGTFVARLFWDTDRNDEKGALMTNIQWLEDYDNDNPNLEYASYVFIDAMFESVSQYAFIVDYKESVTAGKFVNQIGAYDAYTAVIDGKEAILAVTFTEDLETLLSDNDFTQGKINWLVELGLRCIGLDDNGVPVYTDTTPIWPTAENAVHFYKGVVQHDESGKPVSSNLDKDCFAVLSYPGGFSFDGGATKTTFEILDDVKDINKVFEEAATIAGHTDFNTIWEPYGAWLIDLDDDGDIDQIYIRVI